MLKLKIAKPKTIKVKYKTHFPDIILANLQEKEVEPTTETQIIEADYGYDGLKQVEIKPIPSEYIKPTGTKEIIENGIHNVKEFENVNVNVSYTPNYQEKTIIPMKGEQEIIADEEYDALEKVIVKPIPDEYIIPSGELEITENGQYDVKEYEKVGVNVVAGGIDDYFNTNYKDYDGEYASYWLEKFYFKKQPPEINIEDKNMLMNSLQNFARDFKSQYIPKINFENNVTTMAYMFDGCSYVETIDVSGWNTKNVTSMGYLFNNCKSLKKILNINKLNTSQVTDISRIFYNCSNLTDIDVSSFDTSQVTNMYGMFYNCSNLTDIDVSSFDTLKTTDMGNMFRNCTGLTSLDLSNFDANSVTSVSNTFGGCSNLVNLTFMKNIGKAYTQTSSSYSPYRISLTDSTNLTHDSLMSVINNLYDLNLTYDVANGGTLYTQSLVLGATNKAKLTEEEMAIATAKGWVIS